MKIGGMEEEEERAIQIASISDDNKDYALRSQNYALGQPILSLTGTVRFAISGWSFPRGIFVPREHGCGGLIKLRATQKPRCLLFLLTLRNFL